MKKRESRKELLNYIEELKRRIDQLLDIRAELEANNSDLARKLSETERKLSEIELYNGTAKEAALPKCENEMCMDCIHCVTQMVDGQKRIVGCRKDIDCAIYAEAGGYSGSVSVVCFTVTGLQQLDDHEFRCENDER